jgi:hypothetical protein
MDAIYVVRLNWDEFLVWLMAPGNSVDHFGQDKTGVIRPSRGDLQFTVGFKPISTKS